MQNIKDGSLQEIAILRIDKSAYRPRDRKIGFLKTSNHR